MLLHRLIALENLKKTQLLIDEDQKLALLHAPFTGTTLFGGEYCKRKRSNAVTVFLPSAPSVSSSSRPYVGRGRNFSYSDRRVGYSRRGCGQGRGQGRSTPSLTNTNSIKSKDGQTTMTVSVPSDSTMQKTEQNNESSQTV